MNATWPLAKLVANSDELTLRVVVLKYSFPKASIVRISEHTGPLAGVLLSDISTCETELAA
jgi:hypothetical protein